MHAGPRWLSVLLVFVVLFGWVGELVAYPTLPLLICALHCALCIESEGLLISECLECANCVVNGPPKALSAGTKAQFDHSAWLRGTADDIEGGASPDSAVRANMPSAAPGHAWRLERHPTQLSIFNLGAVTDTAMVMAFRDSAGAPVDLGNLTPQQALVAVPPGGQIVVTLPSEILNSPYGISVFSTTHCGQNGQGYAYLAPGQQASVPALSTFGIAMAFLIALIVGFVFFLRRHGIALQRA